MQEQQHFHKHLQETGDGSHTLYVPELAESYHSGKGALAESQYVFIEAGLNQLVLDQEPIQILEVGFGTGLNALLTCLAAEKKQVSIDYLGLEPYPLTWEQVQPLNYPAFMDEGKAQTVFQDLHQSPFDHWTSITPNFQLYKTQTALGELPSTGCRHLVYFDAFAPSRQPAMWEKRHLQNIASQIPEGGIFVTYSAKGQVRRDLMDCGFAVERMPGPPGKREMLRGTKQ